MALSRLLLGWALVTGWLLGWDLIARRGTGSHRRIGMLDGGEALLLTLFGALWFGSLGAGAWWLVFGLVAALREWPIRSPREVARIFRLVGAGGLLAWVVPS